MPQGKAGKRPVSSASRSTRKRRRTASKTPPISDTASPPDTADPHAGSSATSSTMNPEDKVRAARADRKRTKRRPGPPAPPPPQAPVSTEIDHPPQGPRPSTDEPTASPEIVEVDAGPSPGRLAPLGAAGLLLDDSLNPPVFSDPSESDLFDHPPPTLGPNDGEASDGWVDMDEAGASALLTSDLAGDEGEEFSFTEHRHPARRHRHYRHAHGGSGSDGSDTSSDSEDDAIHLEDEELSDEDVDSEHDGDHSASDGHGPNRSHADEDEDERVAGLHLFGRHGAYSLGGGAAHLLSHLGFPGNGGQYRQLLTALRNRDDPTAQLMALQELSELLSMATEESLAGQFNQDAFVKELVRLLKGTDDQGLTADSGAASADQYANEYERMLATMYGAEGAAVAPNPNVMLLACRCLFNLIEALPAASGAVAAYGAIPALCAKLMDIEYIDLAEQALSTLEKISQDFPVPVVREGGLAAVLNYIDFFPLHVQRTAITTAANCAGRIPNDQFAQVREVLPTVERLLAYSDQRVVEQACLCLFRLVRGVRRDRVRLEELFGGASLLDTLLGFIRRRAPHHADAGTHAVAVGDATFSRVLQTVGLLARGSDRLAGTLLTQGAVVTVCRLLGGPDAEGTEEAKPADTLATERLSPDQLCDLLNLAAELLPPLPIGPVPHANDEAEASPVTEGGTTTISEQPGRALTPASLASSGHFTRTVPTDRLALFRDHPALLEEFGRCCLPVLQPLFVAVVHTDVRRRVVVLLLKVLHLMTPAQIERWTAPLPLAPFAAHLLSSAAAPAFPGVAALHLVDTLTTKCPSQYAAQFRREGVVHRLQEMTELAQADGWTDGSEIESTHEDAAVDTGVSRPAAPANDVSPLEGYGALEYVLLPSLASLTLRNLLVTTPPASDEVAVLPTTNAGPQAGSPNDPNRLYVLRLARWVRARLTHLDALFAGDAAQAPGADALDRLRSVASRLQAEDPVEHTGALADLAQLFSRDNAVTAFELLESNLVPTLEHRLATRVDLAHALWTPSATAIEPPVAHLIRCLHSVLSRQENLAVEVAPTTGGEGSGGRQPASLLTKQLRLRLVPADNEPAALPDHPMGLPGQFVVSVHAIVSFDTLADYLRPRLAASGNTTTAALTLASFQQSLRDLEVTASQFSRRRGEPDDAESRTSALTQALAAFAQSNGIQLPLNGATGGLEAAAAEATRQTAEDGEEEGVEEASAEIQAPDSTRTTPRRPEPGQQPRSSQRMRSAPPTSTTSAATGNRGSHVPPPTGDFRLQFEFDGHPVANRDTIYSALHARMRDGPCPPSYHPHHPANPWSTGYTIKYRRVPVEAGEGDFLTHTDDTDDATKDDGGLVACTDTLVPGCGALLRLLATLAQCNAHLAADSTLLRPLPAAAFHNAKLIAKLGRQLDEPLVVVSRCLPAWAPFLMRQYPFLFPFDLRFAYLQYTAFGYSRSIARWQALHAGPGGQGNQVTGGGGAAAANAAANSLGRLQRQKVRIARHKMLASAAKVMELYGSSASALEIEYFDEVGTGLGPTLEFYATVSKELCRRRLALWRDESAGIATPGDDDVTETDGFVGIAAAGGLFPRPYMANDLPEEVGQWFEFAGQFVAKALLDSRLVDLPLHPAFLDLVLERARPPSLTELRRVDPGLAQSLASLKAEDLPDLALDFTLPGYPAVTNQTNAAGEPADITADNLEAYVTWVTTTTLRDGVGAQAARFRQGFAKVFPVKRLACFTGGELSDLLGGAAEDWNLTTLQANVKVDHGYCLTSPTVQNLLQVMHELSPADRRAFLKFITGSPKLPIGGFKALAPRLTVVCKPCEAPLTSDDYLPSVMTCVNFLKLPNYSTKEVLRERLVKAMYEGQGAFHLS
ncbi:Ubiquitin fusion degradation protein 4 [Tieghemiomyces parasiticus]|uniref:HECT-type E3 ubiquitin transferase n=1 Tax=Tieghemiomyces parasiticus TaxID=78921 RepID=A0A9W8DSK0_9FUNG|nr:Ubiquitin fusion degradation protein 4 [Tieghemiomyces parasiticus]